MKKYNFICRVLKIQKHKNFKFLYVSGFEQSRQLIIKDELFLKFNISAMSIIRGECEKILNNQNKQSFEITSIVSVKETIGNNSYAKEYVSNKNQLMQICKQQIIMKIEGFLQDDGFLKMNSPFTMNSRGTSIASPLKIQGQFVDRYCKITHEIELKKMLYKTLSPLYEVGYVSRDIYSTNKKNFEYNVLEFVSPIHDVDFIETFMKKIVEIANQEAEKLNVQHVDLSNLTVVDLKGKMEETQLNNVIYLNRPVDSPLVKVVNGVRTETIWIYNGISLGHGYNDENDYYLVLEEFTNQQRTLKERNIEAELSEDFLNVMKIGLPDTVSIGLGLDLFLCKFFGFDNFKDYLLHLC